jgi:transcriptional regulator with XRE-family HTH domain
MTVMIHGVEYVPRLNLSAPRELGTLGQALKTMRKGAKLSLDAASAKAGCTKSHLWTLEQDGAEPGLRLAYRLAEAYGVPLLTLALCAGDGREAR